MSEPIRVVQSPSGVQIGETTLAFSPRQNALMAQLIDAKGALVPYDTLPYRDRNTLRVMVASLNRRLGEYAYFIQSERNKGLKLRGAL